MYDFSVNSHLLSLCGLNIYLSYLAHGHFAVSLNLLNNVESPYDETACMKDVLNCTPALMDWKLSQIKASSFFHDMWLHQGKNTFRIKVMSHNAEQICTIFNNSLKHSMVLQVAKYFAHLSCAIILQ